MAVKKLKFSEDHIALIKNFYLENFSESRYGIDNYNLWGGTFIYEQMALILGYHDKQTPGSELDVTGPRYPQEIIDYFNELDSFIVTNLPYIFDILLQYCDEGIQPGVVYQSTERERIWKKL